MQPSQRVVTATASAISSRVLASSAWPLPSASLRPRYAPTTGGLASANAPAALRRLVSVSVQLFIMVLVSLGTGDEGGPRPAAGSMARARLDQAAAGLRRMRAQRLLDRVGAPAGPVRHQQVAVAVFGRMREQLVVPGEPVDVGFHDAEVGHRAGKMRVHEGAQV